MNERASTKQSRTAQEQSKHASISDRVAYRRCKRYEHLGADPELTGTAIAVGNIITSLIDNATGVATVGYDKLAKRTGRARSNVVAGVKLLLKRGHFVIARLGRSAKDGRRLPGQYRDGPYLPASTVEDETVPAEQYGQTADRTCFEGSTVPAGRQDSMNLNDKSGAPPTSSPSGSAVAPQEEHTRKLHPFELQPLQSLDELQAKAAEMRAAARKSNGITAPSTSEAA